MLIIIGLVVLWCVIGLLLVYKLTEDEDNFTKGVMYLLGIIAGPFMIIFYSMIRIIGNPKKG